MPEANQENGQHVCPVHSVLWEGLQRDLKRGEATMQKQQLQLEEITETLQEHTLAIRDMERALRNGLRADVSKINDNLNSFAECIKKRLGEHEERICELDGFAWFRDWITKVRDNMFLHIVKGFFIIAIVLFAIQVADLGIEKLVAALFKIIGG